MLNFLFDIYLTLPEIYLITSLLLLVIFGVLLSGSSNYGYPLLSKITNLFTIQILVNTLILYLNFPYVSCVTWNNLFFLDSFSKGSCLMFLVFLIFWGYFSCFYNEEEKINSFEYWILILFCSCGLLFLFQIYDLLSLYIIIELQSLSFYIIASYKRNSEFSTEAGLKYFVAGAFSSALLLFGCSFIYLLTGTTNFEDFNLLFIGLNSKDLLFYTSTMLLSFLFIACALLFKVGGAPFHMWVPDVYEGSPLITTSFFSIFPKFAILTLLLKIYFFSFNIFFNFWVYFFLFSSFFSLLVGSFGALMQTKWKRLLAYSSINHLGFILLGFSIADHIGILSICIYIVVYIFTNYALFSLLIGYRLIKYPFQHQLRSIEEIRSLHKMNPILASSITLILFSMAGIPPLGGFFAKVFILITCIQSNTYSLLIFAVLVSCVSAFYYIRIIQLVFFAEVTRLPIQSRYDKKSSHILGVSISFLLLFFLDIDLFYFPVKHFVLTSLM